MVKSLGVQDHLPDRPICQNSRTRRLRLIEHDPQRYAGEHRITRLDIDRVLTRGLKLEPLNVQHEIARDEVVIRGESHLDLRLKGWHDSVAVIIDERDAELVLAFVFGAKTDTQGQRTLGMHHRHLPRADRVKTAKHAQLSVVVIGRIAKRGYENFHRETKRLPLPLASDIQI